MSRLWEKGSAILEGDPGGQLASMGWKMPCIGLEDNGRVARIRGKHHRYEKFRVVDQLRDEAQILADVQARNARCIISDGSERFRTPGRFATDRTTDFLR